MTVVQSVDPGREPSKSEVADALVVREAGLKRAALVVDGLLLEEDPALQYRYASALGGLSELASQAYRVGAFILRCQDDQLRELCISAILKKPEIVDCLLPTFCALSSEFPSEISLKAIAIACTIRIGSLQDFAMTTYVNPWRQSPVIDILSSGIAGWNEGLQGLAKPDRWEFDGAYRELDYLMKRSSDQKRVHRDLDYISNCATITEYQAHYLALSALHPRNREVVESALQVMYDVLAQKRTNHPDILLSGVVPLIANLREGAADKSKKLVFRILNAAGESAVQLAPFLVSSCANDLVGPGIGLPAMQLAGGLLPFGTPTPVIDQLGRYLLDDVRYESVVHVAALNIHEKLLPVMGENEGAGLVQNLSEFISPRYDFSLELRKRGISAFRGIGAAISNAVVTLNDVVTAMDYPAALREEACVTIGEMNFDKADEDTVALASKTLMYPLSRREPVLTVKSAASAAHTKLKLRYPERFVGTIRL